MGSRPPSQTVRGQDLPPPPQRSIHPQLISIPISDESVPASQRNTAPSRRLTLHHLLLPQPLDELPRQERTQTQSGPQNIRSANTTSQARRRAGANTHIPSFVTIRYVPLGWKPPSISPLPSTWMLPKMSSGLVSRRQHCCCGHTHGDGRVRENNVLTTQSSRSRADSSSIPTQQASASMSPHFFLTHTSPHHHRYSHHSNAPTPQPRRPRPHPKYSHSRPHRHSP